MANRLKSIPLGQILLTEVPKSLSMRQNQLAAVLQLSPARIKGNIGVCFSMCPDSAVGSMAHVRTKPDRWLNPLQCYNAEVASLDFISAVACRIRPCAA